MGERPEEEKVDTINSLSLRFWNVESHLDATHSTPPRNPSDHVVHYPLNGLDLSLSRYYHHGLDVADILAYRLMREYLNPTRLTLQLHDRRFRPTFAVRLWNHPRKIVEDANVLSLLLSTHSAGERSDLQHEDSPSRNPGLNKWSKCHYFNCRMSRYQFFEHFILEHLQRHHLEASHPEMADWLSYWPVGFSPTIDEPHAPHHHFALTPADRKRSMRTAHWWDPDDLNHARLFRPRFVQQRYALFSEGPLRRRSRAELSINTVLLGPMRPPPRADVFAKTADPDARPYFSRFPRRRAKNKRSQRLSTKAICNSFPRTSAARRTGRSASEPPPGAYMIALVPHAGHDCLQASHTIAPREIFFPKAPFSDLARRYRRRSLSRRNIKDMFHVPSSEGGCLYDVNQSFQQDPQIGLCNDCRIYHPARLPSCPFCDAPTHDQQDCPAPKTSRCKCRPFPQRHLAKNCPIPCTRPCGSPYPPGHVRHPNAMTCKSRCCMCGLKGHSGRECRNIKCRCGGRHLGQDCGWNPTCRVEGCDRYWCGVHCRECGSTERPFVGWRCRECLSNGRPVGRKAEEVGSVRAMGSKFQGEMMMDREIEGMREEGNAHVGLRAELRTSDDDTQSSKGIITPDTQDS